MTDAIRRMDIAEFRELGFLQEVNRLVLHPAGLALEVHVAADGTQTLGGVWDYRDDPEGIIYCPKTGIDGDKVERVQAEIASHSEARIALIGSIVQVPS